MPYKLAFISLGCAKNLVNTEQMMALCREAGHIVTGDPEGADVAVLNTCGFIESAKSEAIDNIIQLGELKQAWWPAVSASGIPGTSGPSCPRRTVCWARGATPMWCPPWRS